MRLLPLCLLAAVAHAETPIYKMAGIIYKDNHYVGFAEIPNSEDFPTMEQCRAKLQQKVLAMKLQPSEQGHKILGACFPVPKTPPEGT